MTTVDAHSPDPNIVLPIDMTLMRLGHLNRMIRYLVAEEPGMDALKIILPKSPDKYIQTQEDQTLLRYGHYKAVVNYMTFVLGSWELSFMVESPDLYVFTSKDMTLARFGHMNYIIRVFNEANP